MDNAGERWQTWSPEVGWSAGDWGGFQTGGLGWELGLSYCVNIFGYI